MAECASDPSPQDRTTEQEIKAFSLKHGAQVAGITTVEEFNKYAPPGHQPQDLLKGATSLIVIGAGLISGGYWHTSDSRALANEGHRAVMQFYGTAQKVADYIQTNYRYYSIRAPNTDPMTELAPKISFKLAAELAGLGTRSLAGGILLNPDYGMLNFDIVITAMPLRPDQPLTEPVCPAPSCVKMWERKRTTPCLEAGKVFKCLNGELENGRIKVMKYDNIACAAQQHQFSYRSFQTQLVQIMDEPDREKRKSMILGKEFSRVVYNMSLGEELFACCFECMRFCPVGIQYKQKKISDTLTL